MTRISVELDERADEQGKLVDVFGSLPGRYQEPL